MLTLETPVQVGAFAAAAETFSTIARLDPTNARALAAAGTVVALLAPTFVELEAQRAATALPPIDRTSYEEMLQAARGFALSVATAGQREH